MAEYIEREAALEVVSFYDEDKIREIPAADVEPVRHGWWMWDDEGYHCSECFYHAYGGIGEVLSGNWHYCPNCGALMDKDGDGDV